MDFIALDVETANSDMASICQVGMAGFKDGVIVQESCQLINPDAWFDDFNVHIHGISATHVKNAPKFDEYSHALNELLAGMTCVIHTHFDRSAIAQASVRYGVMPPQCEWLDTAMVARRTWEQVSKRGYGLANLASMLGIEFRHHDALEDAKAAGKVLCAAITESGLQVEDWLRHIKKPLHKEIGQDGNPNGPLFGEVLVFTGALAIQRHEAVQMAAELGCSVKTSVTKKVTMLVVGDQDITRLAGHQRSSKHRKALELNSVGSDIRIVGETDFLSMLDIANE